MDIEEMEAGRELDKLIAEKVMGFIVERRGEYYAYYNDALSEERGGRWTSPVPAYSTDISAAWEVVEYWQHQGNMVSVNGSSDDSGWWCVFYLDVTASGFVETETLPTAPLAICHAALFAVNKGAGERETSAANNLS